MKKTNPQMIIKGLFFMVALTALTCTRSPGEYRLEVDNITTSCVSISYMKPTILENRSYKLIGHHVTPEVFCDTSLGYSEISILYSGVLDSNLYKLDIGLTRYDSVLEKDYQKNLESQADISFYEHSFESTFFFQHKTIALFSVSKFEKQKNSYTMRLFTKVSDEIIVSVYYEIKSVKLTLLDFKKQALKITKSFKLT